MAMRPTRIAIGLLLIAVVAAVALLWSLPASLALRWAAPEAHGIAVEGVSGSVWNGRAEAIRRGDLTVRDVRWTIARGPLLWGEIQGHGSVGDPRFVGGGAFRRGAGGTLSLDDLHFLVDAAELKQALDLQQLRPVGQIELDVERLGWADGLRQIEGSLLWRDAAVEGETPARLGDLQATFVDDGAGGVDGRLSDLGGPLGLTGTVRVEWPTYQIDARLTPRDGDRQLVETLARVGTPQADGSAVLSVTGTTDAGSSPQRPPPRADGKAFGVADAGANDGP